MNWHKILRRDVQGAAMEKAGFLRKIEGIPSDSQPIEDQDYLKFRILKK